MYFEDSKGTTGKQGIFVPFTLNKRYWNTNMPIVFLDKVYEVQLDEGDKDVACTTLTTFYTYRDDERFQKFCKDLVDVLGEILNCYNGLNESNDFWQKLLYHWVVAYSSGIRFKIEQFNNFIRRYPVDKYSYFSFGKATWSNFLSLDATTLIGVLNADEEYHFFSYSWLAAKYFGFQVEKRDIGDFEGTEKKGLFSFGLFGGARKLFIRTLSSMEWILIKAFSSRLRVGVCGAECGLLSSVKWFLWSHGAIQKVAISLPKKEHKIDKVFRNALTAKIIEKMNANEEERMILDFLPKVFPKFYLEDFKALYDEANCFIERHPHLVLVYTLTGMLRDSLGKICMLLLQKRGGKVVGQQHGGGYQLTTNSEKINRELELNDIFYFWGESALSYTIEEFPDCRISFAPSHKLEKDGLRTFCAKLFSKMRMSAAENILFVGTAIEAYPRSYHQGNSTAEAMEYMERKMQFLSMLSDNAKRMTVVREYPVDYGWHMKKRIEDEIPGIRISSREPFDTILRDCSLFISDHLSTTWKEALYWEKPVILLLFDHEISIQPYRFRKEEKPYIDMLAEVGIIIYSPAEAATLVNRLVENGVMNWWLDEERQRVIRLVKKRWTTKVDNIDVWWYHELMVQAEKVEKGLE